MSDFSREGASEMVDSTSVISTELVELSIPADLRRLRVARLAVSAVATDLGFSVDCIRDLSLAVDEACVVLIDNSVIGTRVNLRCKVDHESLVVEGICTTSPETSALSLHPVVETVLKTTVEQYEFHCANGTGSFRLQEPLPD